MQDPSSQSTSVREIREAEGRSATPTATHGEAEINLGIRVGVCTAGVGVSTPSVCIEKEAFAQ
eukprot:4490323-Prymnesium_polylepis.1